MNSRLSKLLMLLLIGIAGCSSTQQLHISFSSSDDVNHGGNPIVVRVYQLKSAGNFQRSSLESFWEDDTAALNGDLVGEPVEVLLRPDETQSFQQLQIRDETVYLAAAADFYQPDRDRWRDILDISEYDDDVVHVLVGNNRLAIRSPQ